MSAIGNEVDAPKTAAPQATVPDEAPRAAATIEEVTPVPETVDDSSPTRRLRRPRPS